jgi:7-alpha-hydroxysteroid dehydrogenase
VLQWPAGRVTVALGVRLLVMLEERVAIITGAGRGIGAAIARRLAAEGCDVVLVARGVGDLERVAAEVSAAGRVAEVVAADLGDPAAASAVIERSLARFGRLDVVVNNAGGAAPAPFRETTSEDLERAFRFNVSASFQLIKLATPRLLESDCAAVINISSRMDRLTARGLLTYGTVKAALSHMTRLLAVELAPRIRVNAISPGVVATEGLREALDAKTRRQIETATPLHRLASVEDIANAAAWLASPRANYITGKVIELDGGAEWPMFPNDAPDLEPYSED